MAGAPKKCAREGCGKTVYPIEELKCLDKVWHKGCFKCTVCGMTLNMKNYKGYNKMPYCEPHYPKTVATVVSDTPEMNRIRENTKVQSNVQYHAEFEKMKGKMTNVSLEDPELQRHMKNTQVVSNAAYHHDIDRKTEMEKARPQLEQVLQNQQQGYKPPHAGAASADEQYDNAPPPQPFNYQNPHQSDQSHLVFSSEHGGAVAANQRAVGKIDDYDPLNGQWGSSGGSGGPPPQQNQQARHLPAGARAVMPNVAAPTVKIPQQQLSPQQNNIRPQQQQHSPKQQTGKHYRAIYDYTAADTDEVTFTENDIILNCQMVDEGWMTGTVKRTNQWGMLPANYVEPQ